MTFANHCGFRKNFPKNEHKCPRHPPQMKWIARTDNNNIWRYQKIHSSRLTADEKDRSAQLTITGKIFGAAFQTFAIMPRCWLGQMTEYIRIDWFCSNFAARDVLYTFGPLFPKVIIDSKRDFNSEEELLEEGCKISACYVACLCQPHCFFVATKPTNQQTKSTDITARVASHPSVWWCKSSQLYFPQQADSGLYWTAAPSQYL